MPNDKGKSKSRKALFRKQHVVRYDHKLFHPSIDKPAERLAPKYLQIFFDVF